MEKKNHEITSQFEADAISNALGDLDQLQVARFQYQSTKNQNLKGKTFNMLDSNSVAEGIEPGTQADGEQLDSDEDGEMVRESDMPGDAFFQSGGLDIGDVRLSQPNLGAHFDAHGQELLSYQRSDRSQDAIDFDDHNGSQFEYFNTENGASDLQRIEDASLQPLSVVERGPELVDQET